MLEQFFFQFSNDYIYDHFRTEAGESYDPANTDFAITCERL